MKKQIILLIAATLVSNQGFAATTTTSATTVLASADAANSAANANVATIEKKSAFGISYTGIMFGPGLDFSAAKQKIDYTDDSKADMKISNRAGFKYNITEAMDAGVQARFGTTFTKVGMTAANENSRLFMNFKKLLPTDIGSLTLTPRVVLPMTNGSHNAKMTYSPELIAQYSIEPKNSRFTFNAGVQVIKNLYYSDAVSSDSQLQFYSLGIAESAYQLNPSTQLTLAYYPEFGKNTDLANKTTSNEIDLGFSLEFAKGWSVNPLIATELNALKYNEGNILKSSGMTVIVSGALL